MVCISFSQELHCNAYTDVKEISQTNKQTNKWLMKTTSSSGILKTIYHNDSYLLLFEKRKL